MPRPHFAIESAGVFEAAGLDRRCEQCYEPGNLEFSSRIHHDFVIEAILRNNLKK